MAHPAALAPALALVLTVSACTKETGSTGISSARETDPRAVMLRIGKRAQACWFKAKDPAFAGYRMADEVNSYSGQPRILIVPRRNPGGLPKMVVQAQKRGSRVEVTTFGPLADGKDGPRLIRAVQRWERGETGCA